MTVKELIEKLKKCNPEGEIVTEYPEGFFPVNGIIDYTGDGEVYIIEIREKEF